MPLVKGTEAPQFDLPNLRVRGLASPQRGARETCVWRITIAPESTGFPHAVTREEVFLAIAGRARAIVDDVPHDLDAGDALIVPAGARFSLGNPHAEPFEAVVSFPVGGQAVTGEGTFTPPWAV